MKSSVNYFAALGLQTYGPQRAFDDREAALRAGLIDKHHAQRRRMKIPELLRGERLRQRVVSWKNPTPKLSRRWPCASNPPRADAWRSWAEPIPHPVQFHTEVFGIGFEHLEFQSPRLTTLTRAVGHLRASARGRPESGRYTNSGCEQPRRQLDFGHHEPTGRGRT